MQYTVIIVLLVTAICLIAFPVLAESSLVEETFPAGDVSSISFDIAIDKLTIGLSGDDMIHVSYNTSGDGQYTLELKDGVLRLKQEVALTSLFDFEFMTKTHECALLIPASFTGDAEVKGTTAVVSVADIHSLSKLRLSVVTLNAHAENCAFGEFNIECTTGDISAKGVSCQSLETRCTTGKIVLDAFDAKSIFIEAGTCDISGTLAGSKADYTIKSHVSYGRNTLPDDQTGTDRQLTLNAGTGNVSINFAS